MCSSDLRHRKGPDLGPPPRGSPDPGAGQAGSKLQGELVRGGVGNRIEICGRASLRLLLLGRRRGARVSENGGRQDGKGSLVRFLRGLFC